MFPNMKALGKFLAAAMCTFRRGEDFLQRFGKRCRMTRRGEVENTPRRTLYAAATFLSRRGEIRIESSLIIIQIKNLVFNRKIIIQIKNHHTFRFHNL